jgi:hypothetical protein
LLLLLGLDERLRRHHPAFCTCQHPVLAPATPRLQGANRWAGEPSL